MKNFKCGDCGFIDKINKFPSASGIGEWCPNCGADFLNETNENPNPNWKPFSDDEKVKRAEKNMDSAIKFFKSSRINDAKDLLKRNGYKVVKRMNISEQNDKKMILALHKCTENFIAGDQLLPFDCVKLLADITDYYVFDDMDEMP